MSGITQGYTDANIAIFGLSAKIKADFVGKRQDFQWQSLNRLKVLKDFKVVQAISEADRIRKMRSAQRR